MPDPMAGLPPRFLRTSEAARYLGLSGRTLEKHRTYGTPPLPDTAQPAAQAKRREPYEGFVEALGRQLAKGQSRAKEISQDVTSKDGASDRTDSTS
jgi:hypothetical protein